LVVAAYAFPATGEAAQRASAFFDRLARPALSTSVAEISPAPVAGLVIGLMGLVLLAIGSGLLTPHAYGLTLAAGAVLTIIGAAMMRARLFPRRVQSVMRSKTTS